MSQEASIAAEDSPHSAFAVQRRFFTALKESSFGCAPQSSDYPLETLYARSWRPAAEEQNDNFTNDCLTRCCLDGLHWVIMGQRPIIIVT